MSSAARSLRRVEARPDPQLWGTDEPMTLQEYIATFYPNGPLTVTSLRTEINKGRLTYSQVAGKFFITPAAVSALFRPTTCPDKPKGLGSISAVAERIAGPAGASQTSISSETDRLRSAQAAVQIACQRLRGPLPDISPKNGRRQSGPKPADVIHLRS